MLRANPHTRPLHVKVHPDTLDILTPSWHATIESRLQDFRAFVVGVTKRASISHAQYLAALVYMSRLAEKLANPADIAPEFLHARGMPKDYCLHVWCECRFSRVMLDLCLKWPSCWPRVTDEPRKLWRMG